MAAIFGKDKISMNTSYARPKSLSSLSQKRLDAWGAGGCRRRQLRRVCNCKHEASSELYAVYDLLGRMHDEPLRFLTLNEILRTIEELRSRSGSTQHRLNYQLDLD